LQNKPNTQQPSPKRLVNEEKQSTKKRRKPKQNSKECLTKGTRRGVVPPPNNVDPDPLSEDGG